MHPPLTDKQALRYSRHILLPQMDFEGQERLLASKALVIGAGGLGCAALPYLVSAGVGHITVVDFDNIELSNLQRQTLFTDQDIGRNKAHAAVERLTSLNPDSSLFAIDKKLDDAALRSLIDTHDIVLDCCDNLPTRSQLNTLCFESKTPLVSGAAIRFEGQITTFNYQEHTPCYHCFSHTFGEQNLTCIEAGVIAPLVGIVGTQQSLEVIKILTGIGSPLVGRLLVIDGLAGDMRTFNYPKRPSCTVCQNNPA